MMTPNRFALQPHLDALYAAQAKHTLLQVTTTSEFEQWQSALRTKIRSLLGLGDRPPRALEAERLHSIDRGKYVEEKYSLAVGEQVQTPLYLLLPKCDPPFKPILVFHGHDPSIQAILGNYPDAETARANRAIDNNYGQALAEAGYLVCAVEQRGIGERLTQQTGDDPFPRSCRHLAFEYLLQGRTLLGERCWDGLCAIEYLRSRPDVSVDRLGCTGHSGGGCTALWLAALDERITTLVVSGYFCSFKDSVLAQSHCECNYVPGILELAEMGDLGALIAPRPFRVIHGFRDEIFPARATSAQFACVKHAYRLCGHADACSLTLHDGAHAYHHGLSQAWFAQWL